VLPNWVCFVTKHYVHLDFPFPWGYICSCPFSKFRVGTIHFNGKVLFLQGESFSALISDVWDAKGRGTALAVFTVAPFAGPGIGPVVAGYLVLGGVSWHWLFWILTIFASLASIFYQSQLTYF
jgi:MFS family permease